MPERVSGPPPLMLPGAALGRGSFLLAGAALQALDGTRARFGAPRLDAARRVSAGRGSTSGSGRCPSAFRGPPLLGSLAARFCWQGQHFRLWTVPERVLDAARRSTWQPHGSFLLAEPERVSGPPS